MTDRNTKTTRSVFINFSKLAGYDVRVTGDMKDFEDMDAKSVANSAVLFALEEFIKETEQEIVKLKKSRAKAAQSKLTQAHYKLKSYKLLKSQLQIPD